MPDGLRSTCKSCSAAATRDYSRRNPGKAAESSLKWRTANPERMREIKKAWNDANKEHNSIRLREWKRANTAAVNDMEHRRRVKRLGNGIYAISKREARQLYASNCFYCGSTNDITLDHLIPITRGGRHSIGNLVPACRSCNSSKNDRTIMEWKLSKKVVA